MSIRLGASAVIVRDGKVLLVEFMDEHACLHYNLPGGGVHDNEPLQDAVRREVLEETSLAVVEVISAPSHVPYILNEAL